MLKFKTLIHSAMKNYFNFFLRNLMIFGIKPDDIYYNCKAKFTTKSFYLIDITLICYNHYGLHSCIDYNIF
jgi:hypothetical protein